MDNDDVSFWELLIGGTLATAAIYGWIKYDSKKTKERKNKPIKYSKGFD
ncbi:hypothetical protein OMY_00595 [Enterococcus sulfureus ATCC 49903]|uniref:Uncharacterized protein n=1 Tax=Enterococcus sulfureus ATCC 49903 TaxID=1140003 RepID=S0P141_9ENTE|nr:hypothetical protein [Enterococcus sulfureus]EOT48640.1 hypothetical protein OMY_00595 [Enterococcus sulfureus ATCC 49903]EOT87532.1 hypothetical protein I573_00588 [Enterococcus sulfureus ATCC 49903]